MLKSSHNNVTLKKRKVEKETTTASRIILADNVKSVPSYATVIAIGPDSKTDIKENDEVVYKEYSSANVKLDEEEYIIVGAEDILAVLV